MPRNLSDAPDVRTVKTAERTVIETTDRVQIPDHIANDPRWKRLWQFLLSDPNEPSGQSDEAA